MSCVEIYTVNEKGDVTEFGIARNSFGGAMHIWSIIADKYMSNVTGGIGGLLLAISGNQCQQFWDLFNSGKLSERDNILFGSTFDHMICEIDQLNDLIEAFKSFHDDHPSFTLAEIIQVLKTVPKEKDIRGICFNQTSVVSDMWTDMDDQENTIPYNVDAHSDDVLYLFEEIKKEKTTS